MALIHPAVPWIEMTSGIDVTPCTDADGKWNPGPSCKDFSLDPLATGRTWANGCAEPVLSGPATTCGGGGDAGLSFDSGNSSGRDSGRDAATPPDARSDGSGLDAAGGRAGGAGAGGDGGRAGGASGAAGDGGRGVEDAGGGPGGTAGVGTAGVGTGAGGSTGTAGRGGAGGASGSGKTGGASGDNSIRSSTDASAGCTCGVPGGRSGSHSGQRTFLVLAIGALLAARRRRDRASV
jgi:hypothetical protein